MENQFINNWSYTLNLLITYVVVFSLWLQLSRTGVLIVGGIAVAFLAGYLLRSGKNRYFTNRVDTFLHACVVVDIALECWFVYAPDLERKHPGYSFLWCAVGFAAVIVFYRRLRLKANEKN